MLGDEGSEGGKPEICVGDKGFDGLLGSDGGKPESAVGLIGLLGDEGSVGGRADSCVGDSGFQGLRIAVSGTGSDKPPII